MLKIFQDLRELPKEEQKRSNIRNIIAGFILIITLLIIMGFTTLGGVNTFFETLRHYSETGELLISLDRARLYEQTFEKENSLNSADKAQQSIDQSIKLANTWNTNKNPP
ncbi:hypothetical protein [Psychromonas sp. MME2]|uniref:hypothetical protein n=1 Tax=Psychromonas sp. MME2 TaxID=3231033 RepID=UPI00339CB46D